MRQKGDNAHNSPKGQLLPVSSSPHLRINVPASPCLPVSMSPFHPVSVSPRVVGKMMINVVPPPNFDLTLTVPP